MTLLNAPHVVIAFSELAMISLVYARPFSSSQAPSFRCAFEPATAFL